MLRFVIRRILIMIPLLFGVSFISFALMNLIPGSPVAMTARSNPKIRQEDINRIREQLGLNDPWPQRYVEWLRDVVFHLDFGPSFYNRLPVTDRIWAAMPNTLLLTSAALLFSLAVSIPFGIYSAVYHKRAFDRLVNIFSVALYSIPLFWLGILLIILFSVQSNKWDLWWFPTLPSGGDQEPARRRRRYRSAGASDSANDHPGQLPDRRLDRLHPLVDARGARAGLHPHGEIEGRA
jgi:nickel transport system permease protein